MAWQDKYPTAIAVTDQERIARELAAARLSLRHARRCISPAVTEQTPMAPVVNANVNKNHVDVLPPKSSKKKNLA